MKEGSCNDEQIKITFLFDYDPMNIVQIWTVYSPSAETPPSKDQHQNQHQYTTYAGLAGGNTYAVFFSGVVAPTIMFYMLKPITLYSIAHNNS